MSDTSQSFGVKVIEDRTLKIVIYRLVPFLFIAYIVNFIDRVNIGYASLTMNSDIGLSATSYGLGAGLFFVGYVLFEVPSNLMLEKVGARRWIARIMVTWGIISAAMSLVKGPLSFDAVRLFLGIAEAGFFPGVILYITYWFPQSYHGRIVALFMSSMPVAGIIGAPLSTYLLSLDGMWHLHGWQHMFIFEGTLAVVLGAFAFFYLTDGPKSARWLDAEQKTVIVALIDAERPPHVHGNSHRIREIFLDGKIILLSSIYFCILMGLYGVSFWLPQIIKGLGLGLSKTGLVSAIPYVLSAIVMVLWGRHSDRTGERIWHLALANFVCCAGFLITAAFAGSAFGVILGMSAALIGVFSAAPPFWALTTRMMAGDRGAASIALVTCIGALGGIVAPAYIGWMKDSFGTFTYSLAGISLIPALGGIMSLRLNSKNSMEAAPI